MAASPHDRAVELIHVQLELDAYRIARQAAGRLAAENLLGDETTLTHQLEQARRVNVRLAVQLDRAHKRLLVHLDDPDVVTAMATGTAMPGHDSLVRDLLRIFDGGE